jgi:general secretion pathway protein K
MRGSRGVALRRRSRGVALIGVLLMVALLAALTVAAMAQLRADAHLVANMISLATAHHAAEAGVQRGLYELAAPRTDAAWPADGTAQELGFGEATVRVTLSDAAGRIDLNLAPEALLERLAERAPGGAAAGRALAEQIAARRRSAPFQSVEELAELPGMHAALYRALRPALTVHSRQPGIIAEAASRQVLLAVPGADEAEVERYLAARERQRAAGLPPPPPPGEREYFARNGNATFDVHAEARLPNGLRSHVAATVDLRRPGWRAPYRVIEWRHEGPELFAPEPSP